MNDGQLLSGVAFLSWCAGTFESEGTVTITRSGRRANGKSYTRPLVCLTSTDLEMVEVFQKRWPGRIAKHQPAGNSKIAYTWRVNVRQQIARFLWDVLPFLRTDRVRVKAQLVLDDIGARVQGARGSEYHDECHARREVIRGLNKRGAHHDA